MRVAILTSETGLKFCLFFLPELQLNSTTSHICLINTFWHNLEEASILAGSRPGPDPRRPHPPTGEHRTKSPSIDAEVGLPSFIANGQTGVTYCTLVRKGEVISA